jgi:rhodanese-related sulfurtransferase
MVHPTYVSSVPRSQEEFECSTEEYVFETEDTLSEEDSKETEAGDDSAASVNRSLSPAPQSSLGQGLRTRYLAEQACFSLQEENAFLSCTSKTHAPPFDGTCAREAPREKSEGISDLFGKSHWTRGEPLEKSQTFPNTAPSPLGCLSLSSHTYSSILPTTGTGPSDSMLRISTETVAALLQAKHHRYRLIDCRFRYEYEGGHVRTAENAACLQDMCKIIDRLGREAGEKEESELPIIFYCEYSSIRAPKLALFLRNEDRKRNIYPKLFFPHIYVMEGGYRGFFRKFPLLCSPEGYVPMRMCTHAREVLRHVDNVDRSSNGNSSE